MAALAATDLMTVAGKVDFNDQNFSVAPLGGAQWQRDEAGNLIKQNVFNDVYPDVAKTAEMRLYQQ